LPPAVHRKKHIRHRFYLRQAEFLPILALLVSDCYKNVAQVPIIEMRASKNYGAFLHPQHRVDLD
jgi:hypothetical protein